MKKILRRMLCGLLTAVLLMGGAWALSSEDSLITLSYLKDIFLPEVLEAGGEAAEEMLQDTYDDAMKDLDRVQDDLLEDALGDDGTLYSETLTLRDWSDGQMIALSTGAGFLMQEGTADLWHDGVVIDVTEGIEVPSGSRLIFGHRYLVGEDTDAEITVVSGAARLGVQGEYTKEKGIKKPTPFYDVCRTDWYYDAVNFVVKEGLFAGMSEHEFGPSSVMSRAMVMTVFYNLAGCPSKEMAQATATFDDVQEGVWFTPYVRWAATQGITAGTSATTFSPDLKINREQMVLLLYAFAIGYLDLDLDERADLTVYEDMDSISIWARDAMSWAADMGIIESVHADRLVLNPRGEADRATVASMLQVFVEEYM